MSHQTEIVTIAESVVEQRSKAYVSDAHNLARWVMKLKEATPAERLQILSKDLDGPPHLTEGPT